MRGVDGHHLIRLAWHLGNRLLVINKTDLAPHVGANLDVMEVDTQRVRGDRPYVFADTLRRKGLDKVIEFLEAAGGLSQH